MKMYINFDNETKKVFIDVEQNIIDNEYEIHDAMPYIMDALYDLMVKEQKKNMMR